MNFGSLQKNSLLRCWPCIDNRRLYFDAPIYDGCHHPIYDPPRTRDDVVIPTTATTDNSTDVDDDDNIVIYIDTILGRCNGSFVGNEHSSAEILSREHNPITDRTVEERREEKVPLWRRRPAVVSE